MKIEKINISEITEYENNAKLHPREQIEQIKKSIQEFGNNDPIAIDENNVIIEGHGRYKALKELGFDEVEVIRLSHMDDEQKRAYILAHNKLTMNSGPPYNVAYEGGTEEALTIMNDSMDNESFRKFLRDAFFAADTVLREGGHFTSGTQIQRVTILEVPALILVGQ